jgi:hypothetical protein
VRLEASQDTKSPLKPQARSGTASSDKFRGMTGSER